MPLYLGVVLLPDSATVARARELALKIEGNKIDLASCHLHLSLLQVIVEEPVLADIRALFDKTTIPTQKVEFQCHEISCVKGGYHFLELRQGRDFLELQKSILPLAALRTEDTTFSWFKYASLQQKQMFFKYGYPNIGKCWEPHITIGRTEKPNLHRSEFSHRGFFESMAVVRIGQHAVAEEILHMRTFA